MDLLILFDCLGPEYPSLQSPIRRLTGCLHAAGRALLRKVTQPDHDKLVPMVEPPLQQTADRAGTDSGLPWAGARALSLIQAITRGRSVGEKIANLVVLATLKIPTQSNSLAWTAFMQGLWLQERATGKVSTEEALLFAGRLHSRLYDDLKPFHGRITYFKATQRPPTTVEDEFAGWQPLIAGEFSVHLLPGGHVSLLEPPHAAEVARVLALALAGNQSENQSQE